MLNFFRYNSLIYFRNKSNYIWNIFFPFFFVLIYVMAMYMVGQDELTLPTVTLAVLEEEKGQHEEPYGFTDFLGEMDGKAVKTAMGEDGPVTKDNAPLILYTKTQDKAEAELWLKSGKAYAIVETKAEGKISATVLNTTAQTKSIILKEVLRTYEQVRGNIENYSDAVREGRVSLEALNKRLEAMDQGLVRTKSMDPAKRTSGVSLVHIPHYAMLAYVAFFPVTVGADMVFFTEADRTPQAMRQTVSSYSKRRRFITNLLPVLLFHLILTCLIFILSKNLSIDMGPKPQLFLLMMLVMTLASIFTGSMIAACFSFSQTLVMGLSIGIPLLLGFLSGLMSTSVRDLLVQKAPWLLAVNPISRASTGFFILAGGGPVSLFYKELAGVLIYLVIMLVLTLIGLRRSSYESL